MIQPILEMISVIEDDYAVTSNWTCGHCRGNGCVQCGGTGTLISFPWMCKSPNTNSPKTKT